MKHQHVKKKPSGTGWMCAALFFLFSMQPMLANDEVTVLSRAGIHLIPYPQEVTLRGENVMLGNKVTIVLDKNASEADRFAASELADQLKSSRNITANVSHAPAGTSIILSRKSADKEFFFRQDRAYHFANRRPDMTYLIYDEQLLDIEGYLDKLREYMDFYKITFLEGDLLQEEVPTPK